MRPYTTPIQVRKPGSFCHVLTFDDSRFWAITACPTQDPFGIENGGMEWTITHKPTGYTIRGLGSAYHYPETLLPTLQALKSWDGFALAMLGCLPSAKTGNPKWLRELGGKLVNKIAIKAEKIVLGL